MTSLLQRTRILIDSVDKYRVRDGDPFVFVVGSKAALEILKELRLSYKHVTDDDVTLVNLHGVRVRIEGPPDEVRYMSEALLDPPPES